MMDRPKILVICGKNKKRSRTAEYIFKNDSRFNIYSAGLSPKSERKINEKDLNWVDLVFVMESDHRSKIQDQYSQLDLPKIEVLHIPDEYEYLDTELIDILTFRINDSLKINFEI